MAIKKHRKRTITHKGKDGNVTRSGKSVREDDRFEALPHKSKRIVKPKKHKGSSKSQIRKHQYGGLKPKVKDARDRAKIYETEYSPGKKRKSNFSRKVVKKAGGGKVGDSIKTYASGGYVEGK